MNADIKTNKKKFSETVFCKILCVIRYVIFSIVMIFCVTSVAVSVIARVNGKAPSMFGFSLFRVISHSMEPEYEVGDIILTKSIDPLTLKKCDVVTYYGENDMIITHRVIKEPFKQNGEYYITTMGDSNLFADPNVRISEVIGVVDREIPFLTAMVNYFATPWGLATVIILILYAFSKYIIDFFKSLIYLVRKGQRSADDERAV